MTRHTNDVPRAASAIALALWAGFFIGCGGRSDLATITGKVTYNGQPLAGAEVQFNPVAAGRKSVGYTNPDGEYDVLYTPKEQGALIGPHTVAVFDRSGKTPIPAEFTSLKREVKPGRNTFDFDIKGE